MRAALILITSPAFDNSLGFRDRFEPVQIQTLLAQRSVEGFDEGVVGRFPRATKVDAGVVMICPEIHQLPGELSPVVREEELRSTALGGEAIERLDDMRRPQSAADLCGEGLAAEYINVR